MICSKCGYEARAIDAIGLSCCDYVDFGINPNKHSDFLLYVARRMRQDHASIKVPDGSTVTITQVSPWWRFWDRRVIVSLRLGAINADLYGVIGKVEP